MTRYSDSPSAFIDVDALFQLALRGEPVELSFDRRAACTGFIGRANAYRVLLRKQAVARGEPSACQYDALVIRRPSETTAVIELRSISATIKIGGVEVDPRQLGSVPTLTAGLTAGEPISSPLTESDEEFLRSLGEDEK